MPSLKYELKLSFQKERHAKMFVYEMDKIGRENCNETSCIVWTVGHKFHQCANDLLTAGFLSENLVTVLAVIYNEKDLL